MTILKWLLLSLLLLPIMELAAFTAVAVAIGLGWAVLLIVFGSFCGLMLLRHGGGSRIARLRAAMDGRSVTALQADGRGGLVILSGILLLVPGFVTDAVAVVLLLRPVLQMTAEALGLRRPPPSARSPDGVLDLEPEQWHHVPEAQLRKERNDWPPAR